MKIILSNTRSSLAGVTCIVLALLLCGGCATYRHSTLLEIPPSSPWEKLPDMPRNLGRFALTQDGQNVYRLGGISYNIRSGGAYSRKFSLYDPCMKTWTALPQVPFGTGGAFLEYWPRRKSLVSVAGIARLGDGFNTNGVTVGVFDLVGQTWSVHEYTCTSLGRPSCLAPAGKNTFLILAHDKVAMLDLASGILRVVGSYPVSGRTLGVAKAKKTLFVLQGESRQPCRIHMFDVRDGAYLGSVDTSEKFVWTDRLLVWRNQLVVWKNSGLYDRNRYNHSSRILRIDSKTGVCSELHPDYPGPRARRSSNAVIVGDELYAFGGQRTDSEWLEDTYRYHFLLKDKYYKRSPNNDLQLTK